MSVLRAISDWPVIIQGALGSALFWIVLEAGQRLVRVTTKKLGGDHETANFFSLAAHAAEPGPALDRARFVCVYGALHYCLKALVVVVIALAVGSVVRVFADVGFVIALYFLFRALAFVPHSDRHGSLEVRKKKYEDAVKKVIAEHKEHFPPKA
jgi:hypothetical protein